MLPPVVDVEYGESVASEERHPRVEPQRGIGGGTWVCADQQREQRGSERARRDMHYCVGVGVVPGRELDELGLCAVVLREWESRSGPQN